MFVWRSLGFGFYKKKSTGIARKTASGVCASVCGGLLIQTEQLTPFLRGKRASVISLKAAVVLITDQETEIQDWAFTHNTAIKVGQCVSKWLIPEMI